ncbi:uncharacterized protein SEPMUDRAFT_61349 [Sphaerulina musiva SO2202]|uniref:Uncharacterized protein n=1 Tax=Sphaerulina musiva (strain SO2202) TaxID=692275 RepID=M3C6V0_SPHMS|nr:uncharacterized protein SEPMUDRAFT_61349 [Sphaerulina musiva SO2202]EMF15956.1 hypothetical protein SEPMUDRAFT_61349 [Sphaerulina musiva SO2202]
MPYFKFDDDSLEPREVIRPDLTPYVALLKTKRTRSRRKPKSWPAPGPRASPAPSPRASPEPPSRWTRLDTPPAPISYPASVVPSPSNKRKEKGGYCMRFSRSLDRFHEYPNVYDEAQREPLPTLLRLPAELRQHILDLVLDDNDLFVPRPNTSTRDLALCCKTFETDLREVSKLWKTREEYLRAQPIPQFRADMDAFMADLHAPLRSASLINASISRFRRASLVNTRVTRGRVTATEARRRRRMLARMGMANMRTS